jgi:hypothetical protein
MRISAIFTAPQPDIQELIIDSKLLRDQQNI